MFPVEEAASLAAIIGPVYLVLGLSILIYSKVWQDVMDKFRKDHFSMLTLMLVQLVLGLIVINQYNVWEWNLGLIVTITGWGMFLKGTFYLLAPGSVIKSLLKMKDSVALLYIAGLIVAVAGAALSYYSYFA